MIRSAFLIVSTSGMPVLPETVESVRVQLQENIPGFYLWEERTVASDRYLIEELLRRWCDEEDIDLLLTIGGTFPAPGHSREEITPEATLAVIERGMPSLPEAMRAFALDERGDALLDRSVAGIRTRTLILNIPGDTGLAPLFIEAIADVLPSILARLQSLPDVVAVGPKAGPTVLPKATGLDADEFAAFLAARRNADQN